LDSVCAASLGKWRKESDLHWERTKSLLLTIAAETLTAATLTGISKSPVLFTNLLSVLHVCLGCCCRVVAVRRKLLLLGFRCVAIVAAPKRKLLLLNLWGVAAEYLYYGCCCRVLQLILLLLMLLICCQLDNVLLPLLMISSGAAGVFRAGFPHYLLRSC